MMFLRYALLDNEDQYTSFLGLAGSKLKIFNGKKNIEIYCQITLLIVRCIIFAHNKTLLFLHHKR